MRMARQARGIKLTQMARRLGYTASHLSSVENRSGCPSCDLVEAYERELRLAPGTLTSQLHAQRPLRSSRYGARAIAALTAQMSELQRAFAALMEQVQQQTSDADLHDGVAWHATVDALRNRHQHAQALEACEQVLRRDPALVAAWNVKGRVHRDLQQYSWALEAYEQVLKLDPRSAAAWEGKASALRGLDRLDEAREAYEQALSLNPRSVVAWRRLAETLHALGHIDDAARAYEEALCLDPHDPLAGRGARRLKREDPHHPSVHRDAVHSR